MDLEEGIRGCYAISEREARVRRLEILFGVCCVPGDVQHVFNFSVIGVEKCHNSSVWTDKTLLKSQSVFFFFFISFCFPPVFYTFTASFFLTQCCSHCFPRPVSSSPVHSVFFSTHYPRLCFSASLQLHLIGLVFVDLSVS